MCFDILRVAILFFVPGQDTHCTFGYRQGRKQNMATISHDIVSIITLSQLVVSQIAVESTNTFIRNFKELVLNGRRIMGNIVRIRN